MPSPMRTMPAIDLRLLRVTSLLPAQSYTSSPGKQRNRRLEIHRKRQPVTWTRTPLTRHLQKNQAKLRNLFAVSWCLSS